MNLVTTVKLIDEPAIERGRRRGEEPESNEQGKRIRYDGEAFETQDLPWEKVETIAATDIDYDTKPKDWL